jgi:hypothetical protein
LTFNSLMSSNTYIDYVAKISLIVSNMISENLSIAFGTVPIIAFIH